MKFINRVKNNKLLYFLGVAIIGVFFVLIARFTYAYLGANINEAREDVTLSSDETDKLDFAIGDPLSIDATPTTLPENGTNLVDTTTATATLLANTTNNTANLTYYVYFTISDNTFIYSDGSTPEIILTITDPTGQPVTNVDGLTYGTYSGVAGFDVTTQNGTFTIANGYTITSNSSTDATEQTWTFTLTYLNQSYDQSANYGNSMTTEVSMTKEEVILAYHETCTPGTMACDIARLYTEDGVNDLYYHDGSGTYGSQEAGDNSYRYAGANPNNYVCFGSNAASCPTDNIYRIIGVFDGQVKLIKADYATTSQVGTGGAYYNTYQNNMGGAGSYYKGSQNMSSVGVYYWNPSGSNTWSSSSLTTTNLKTTYLNGLGEWSNLIASHIWQVGGINSSNIESAKNAYTNEIVSPAANTTWSGKIGLMYVSDYGYAASPANWSTNMGSLNNATNRDNNWMFMGLYEWTISRRPGNSLFAFFVNYTGNVDYSYVDYLAAVRPSFYLESDVVLTGGSGTSADPYRIA